MARISHSDGIMTTTYGQLQNGDIVTICGYRFRVRDIRVSSRKGEKTTMHGEPNRDDVIRFNGDAVDADTTIYRTGYNGCVYGAYADVPVAVER